MKKVYVAYGWPEGKWHSKQLSEALTKAGYKLSNLPEKADVIIAHSAGCYMLPPDIKAQLILLIGLPNWPNKLLIKCTIKKVALESKDKYWFQKTLFHVFYALTQPIRLYNVYRTYKRKTLPKSNHVILVRNEQDTYMHDNVSQELAKQRKWSYKNLKGQHDDLWQNPHKYIEIIRIYI